MISGVKRQSDGTAYSGQQFGYGFDDIGNRTEATANGESSEYSANLVNQYTSRTVPGVVDLIGEADSGAMVTVNEEQTARHDDDGNLTQDGRWDYTWNGENRLVKMETRSDLASSVPDLTVEFAYDSQGRRFKKTVTSNLVATTTYFLYDGWNLIAELESDLDPIRTYTWGLDLSGSAPGLPRPGVGAGGVGGLLAVTDASAGSTYYATYDGNGNVMALVDASDGSVDAVYEYDPFGGILRETGGDIAAANPFLFSTKYHDQETGLLYYGYRYLNTDTGRWLSRDPIGERGGVGLYGFCRNRATGLFDPLGHSTSEQDLRRLEKDLYDWIALNAANPGSQTYYPALMLQHYLNGSGAHFYLPAEFLMSVQDLDRAVDANNALMEQRIKDTHIEDVKNLANGETRRILDYFDTLTHANIGRDEIGTLNDFTLTSYYDITATKVSSCKVTFEGRILHLGNDIYDFNPGLFAAVPNFPRVELSDLVAMEHRGLASRYFVYSLVGQNVTGTATLRRFWWDSYDFEYSELFDGMPYYYIYEDVVQEYPKARRPGQRAIDKSKGEYNPERPPGSSGPSW